VIRSDANETPIIAIICTKKHEYDQFCGTLSKEVASFYKTIPNEEKKGSYAFRKWSLPTCILIAVTFGEVQGLVQAATRTAQVIFDHAPKFIGMVGVCAGCKLGDVILAKSASAPVSGRVVKRGAGYVEENKEAGEHVDNGRISDTMAESVRGLIKKLTLKLTQVDLPFQLQLGTMLSYPQVREDCAKILLPLADLSIGLDMEASAFFVTVEILSRDHQVTALPVIKGVSDVGEENLLESSDFFKHNKDALTKSGLNTTDNQAMRRAFREIASKNSSTVMVHLLLEMFCSSNN